MLFSIYTYIISHEYYYLIECATKKQEILFAVDVSKSINDEELELERDAIYGIIGGFDLGKCFI